MGEVIIIPRSFKLLDELEGWFSYSRTTLFLLTRLSDAEKDKGVPPPHAGWVSIGLADANDTSLTNWNATIFGPQGTNLGDRMFTLYVQVPENYPNSPPHIRFISKINMPDVDQKTGEVSPKLLQQQWKKDSSIVLMLCNIRNNMKAASRLPQAPDGATF